jgi:hypothetical protein
MPALRLDRAGLGKKGAGAARGRVRWHYRPMPAAPDLADADRAALNLSLNEFRIDLLRGRLSSGFFLADLNY